MLRFLFPITLFLSAILLFSIQPMAAKALLPIFGGTPAVWTVCMLFFQLILLLGYGYVWLLSSIKTTRWRLLHCGLLVLSVLMLPLSFHPVPQPGHPEWNIVYTLLTQLGLPLLIVAASAPLLQFAYSHTQAKDANDPYFLYAASNFGSLLALLLYPWVIERFVGLHQQFFIWNIVYGLYVCSLLLVLFTPSYATKEEQHAPTGSVSFFDLLTWIFLSFVPCSMMLGVTLYITTDIAATPLFWVLPLALYLFTFIITFNTKPLITHGWVIRNSLFFLTFTLLGFILEVNQVRAWELVLFNLLSFFVLSLLCHGELYQKRPPASSLTLFYLCLAMGGVLAGLFNGIIAPHWFNNVYEYPIAILLSLMVLPKIKLTKGWWTPPIVLSLLFLQYFLPDIKIFDYFSPFQIAALMIISLIVLFQHSNLNRILSLAILFLFLLSPLFKQESILLQQRNFYGVKRVINKDGVHAMMSNSTIHGLQLKDESKPLAGTTSYFGAIEQVIKLMQQPASSLSITIMGLGVGTMVCQHREADKLTVIEIDPQMIALAKNEKLFTYLRDCSPQLNIIKDDGRLAVSRFADHSQDLIILDAFSSDSVPVHLITLEAFKLYIEKLAPKGVILVNISNRHVQLLPVLSAIGRSLDLMVFSLSHKGIPRLGQFDSEWALLTYNQAFASNLMRNSNWRFVTEDSPFLWTDDYSNVIPLLKY